MGHMRCHKTAVFFTFIINNDHYSVALNDTTQAQCRALELRDVLVLVQFSFYKTTQPNKAKFSKLFWSLNFRSSTGDCLSMSAQKLFKDTFPVFQYF